MTITLIIKFETAASGWGSRWFMCYFYSCMSRLKNRSTLKSFTLDDSLIHIPKRFMTAFVISTCFLKYWAVDLKCFPYTSKDSNLRRLKVCWKSYLLDIIHAIFRNFESTKWIDFGANLGLSRIPRWSLWTLDDAFTYSDSFIIH